MSNYFMGIDTGTQGVRVGITDELGNIVFANDKGWDTIYPQPGRAEQIPAYWWECLNGVFAEIAETVDPEIRASIKSVVLDSTSSTVIPVLEDGTPLRNAIMWMDVRAAKEAEAINKTGHPVLKYCGGAVSAEWFVPKVLWVKHNEPEIFEKAWKFVDQEDWMNYMLSGVWSSAICNMTCKGNYVRSLGGYVQEYFDTIGLEEHKEKVIQRVDRAGDLLGNIRPEIAEKYGFNPEMKVLQGMVDAHMGMFGQNAIAEGKMAVTMGTSFVHLGLVNRPLELEGVWGPYEEAVMDGTWCVEGGQASGAGLTNWFSRTFNIPDITDENPFVFMANSLSETEPGAEGLIALDFFQGNRTPYKDDYARGVIFGLTMQHTWKHIYRAILEAVALGTHNILNNLEKQGIEITDIIACGGVTKNKPWIQMIADITGKRIVINRDSQAAVLGGCIIGAGATLYDRDFQKAADKMVYPIKVVEPDMELHERYQPIFEKYKELYESTKHIFRM